VLVGVQRKMKKPGKARLIIRLWPANGSFVQLRSARGGSSNQPAAIVSWTLRDFDTKLVTPVCLE